MNIVQPKSQPTLLEYNDTERGKLYRTNATRLPGAVYLKVESDKMIRLDTQTICGETSFGDATRFVELDTDLIIKGDVK